MGLTKQDKRNIAVIVFAFFALIVSFLFDDFFVGFFDNATMRYLFEWSNHALLFLFVVFLAVSMLLWKNRKKDLIVPLWLSFFSALIISYTIKFIVKRERPFLMQKHILFFKDYSFPSTHVALAFSPIAIVDDELPLLKYMLIFFAVLIAVSRIYLNMHFFSDVVAGAIIGLAVGYSIMLLRKKYMLF